MHLEWTGQSQEARMKETLKKDGVWTLGSSPRPAADTEPQQAAGSLEDCVVTGGLGVEFTD